MLATTITLSAYACVICLKFKATNDLLCEE